MGKKKVSAVPGEKETGKIQWTDERTEILFYFVELYSVHARDKSTKNWLRLQAEFFTQPCMREFAAFGITDDARNLKDKFKRALKEVQRDVETGNQSGKEG
jgi:hypothetical protein